MKVSEAIAILKNEIQCVYRANACDRRCERCDLVREDKDILDAYAMAIGALRLIEDADKPAEEGE